MYRFSAKTLAPLLAILLASCGGSTTTPPPLTYNAAYALDASGNLDFVINLPAGYVGPRVLAVRTANLGSATGFAIGGANCAVDGVDYVAIVNGSLTIPVGQSSETLTVKVCPNSHLKSNNRLELQVDWAGNTQHVTGTIINTSNVVAVGPTTFAAGLNDTGITQCLNSKDELVDCAASDLVGQDGHQGRDAGGIACASTASGPSWSIWDAPRRISVHGVACACVTVT